jgi:hypothetical protein
MDSNPSFAKGRRKGGGDYCRKLVAAASHQEASRCGT